MKKSPERPRESPADNARNVLWTGQRATAFPKPLQNGVVAFDNKPNSSFFGGLRALPDAATIHRDFGSNFRKSCMPSGNFSSIPGVM